MITQIFGVALISLLTITPTIQQNNIEQLIAPNIEIQQNNTAIGIYNDRVWINRPFTQYVFASANTFIRDTQMQSYNFLANFNTWTAVINDNFYFYSNLNSPSDNMSGNYFRNMINEYYTFSRGIAPTSSTFSFSQTSTALPLTTTFYTYTINGSAGSMVGRLYLQSGANIGTHTVNSFNSNVNVPVGSSIQTIVQAVNPQITHQLQSQYDVNIIYYYLNNSINTQLTGQTERILYAQTNYGTRITIGTININVEPDNTLPIITGITGNPINWTNQPVTITVNATDNVGLNATAYSFNGGQTWQQSNQLNTNFNQILEIRVRDTSGNIASQQVTINRIDISSPAILLAGNWKNTFELGELASNQALLSYLSISDNLSGLNTGLTTISNFNFNQAGTYSNIQVSATDNAGNNFVYTLPTVTITQPSDNTGPIITGPTIVNRTEGNITTQGILDLYSITDISGIEPNTISIRDLDNNVITNWSPYTVGSYQLRVYARDTLNNITQYQFTLQVGQAPPPDLTPPTIVGPLLVSFEIGTYEYDSEILNLYTFSDNVAILQNQLIGEINYSELGDYQVTIRSTDTSNNVTNRNIVVRIRDTVVLGNYNPLTDLLSGIFGGALSMIFTIGTINILGLRLLDAMGVIILGAVLMFVYKAIKGGS